MSETHYIELDEEIISAVGRLRRSSGAENIFVFPKRALILQSIINLKLLGREADKLGKKIIVMSQDEQGMRLAEKAGLRVQEYQDAVLRQHRPDTATRFTVKHGESIPMPQTNESAGLRHSNDIGSSSFYTEPPASPVQEKTGPVVTAPPAPQMLRVRNASPILQTALNSKREPMPPAEVHTAGPLSNNDARKEKLRRLFESKGTPERLAQTAAVAPQTVMAPVPPRRVTEHSSGRPWLWSGLGVSFLAVSIVLGYFFLRPEAIISVEPQTAVQPVKLSLVGTADSAAGSVNIPARYLQEEKTIRLSQDATGKEVGNGAKASGLITIVNAYTDAAQSLVATTRFEMSDGKLYRLAEGLTVPGAKTVDGKTAPGTIDARVVADSAGTKFNVSAGAFTIPGFKGGPKYEKITAKVKTPLTGGSDGVSDQPSSVSAADLERARAAAGEEAKKAVIALFMGGLEAGEAVLESSFQTTVIGTPVAPVVGTVATQFDYEARFQVRGFIISEAAVRRIIDQETAESGGVVLKPYTYTVGYGAVLSNFETQRVDLTAESRVLFRATLNEAVLRAELLGLDEEGIRRFLSSHPEIKRLQVEFKPKIFIATIPDDEERVTVRFISSEDE
jgi:hypothetical protein